MFTTSHTRTVNETYFQHLWFTIRLSWYLGKATFCLFLHGITGGLFNAPKGYCLEGMAKRLNELHEGRGKDA